jgi:lipoprotein-releasing system ATP-binding protein
MTDFVQIKSLKKTYGDRRHRLTILNNIDLTVKAGELISVMGPSGSGKSTLLHCLGLLQASDEGTIFIDGQPCHNLSDSGRTAMRQKLLGFVFQQHFLLPDFNALDNIMMAGLIRGLPKSQAVDEASHWLTKLGLWDRRDHKPVQLSGGESQRVALARAFMGRPPLILADEPTGSLDPATAHNVAEIFVALAREQGTTMVFVTHNPDLANYADRSLRFNQGLLV